jgi:hypothetical protein
MSRVLDATISRTKWKSISSCLVRAWKTGLEDKYVAPILSHQRIGGLGAEMPSSWRRDRSLVISATALARCFVFSLSAGTSDGRLFATAPINQILTKEDTVATCGTAAIAAACLVRVSESL